MLAVSGKQIALDEVEQFHTLKDTVESLLIVPNWLGFFSQVLTCLKLHGENLPKKEIDFL